MSILLLEDEHNGVLYQTASIACAVDAVHSFLEKLSKCSRLLLLRWQKRMTEGDSSKRSDAPHSALGASEIAGESEMFQWF